MKVSGVAHQPPLAAILPAQGLVLPLTFTKRDHPGLVVPRQPVSAVAQLPAAALVDAVVVVDHPAPVLPGMAAFGPLVGYQT